MVNKPDLTHDDVFAVGNSLEAQGLAPKNWKADVPMNAMQLPAFVRGMALKAENGRKALEAQLAKITMVDQGGVITPINTNTLAGPVGPMEGVAPLTKTVTPDAALTNTRAVEQGALNRDVTRRGQDVTVRGQNMVDARTREANGILANGLPNPSVDTTAQAIADYKLPPLSGFAMKTPWGQQVTARVMTLNPQYSAQDYVSGAKAVKDFATGKQGNSVRSFNVALSHLDTLDKLADALNNKDTVAVNRVGNFVAQQTGSSAPTNFESAKKIVGDEIVKAIIGSGGGVSDREAAARTISAASSPAQLKGVINTYRQLMQGQLGGLEQQYEQTTGRKDFKRFLSPEGQAVSAGNSQVKFLGFEGQ